MKIEEKLAEAKTRFKKGTQFYSLNYPEWPQPSVQVDDDVEIRNYPNLIWVKAKAPFGEIMCLPSSSVSHPPLRSQTLYPVNAVNWLMSSRVYRRALLKSIITWQNLRLLS